MLHTLLALALADEAGDALLAKVDAANNAGDDAHLVLDVVVTDDKGESAQRTLEIWQKGDDKRLVRYTEPARLAGIGLLVPDGETVYVYLPAYGRPKRVVGDQRSDAFMGTDFSIDDLSRLSWSEEYSAIVEGTDGEMTTLLLTPNDPKQHEHHHVRMWVRPDDHLPSVIEYSDEDNVRIRTVTLTDYRDVGPRNLAHTLHVLDNDKGTSTEATVNEVAFDAGLDDELFTLTALTR
ncbi:MAG TPA: outer membrane lipoprotein-sorting protein [Myxococcota bacterium]|nr:outer membrane lipoprotein-sorting protein [Myxococcota bacterium]